MTDLIITAVLLALMIWIDRILEVHQELDWAMRREELLGKKLDELNARKKARGERAPTSGGGVTLRHADALPQSRDKTFL